MNGSLADLYSYLLQLSILLLPFIVLGIFYFVAKRFLKKSSLSIKVAVGVYFLIAFLFWLLSAALSGFRVEPFVHHESSVLIVDYNRSYVETQSPLESFLTSLLPFIFWPSLFIIGPLLNLGR